MKKYDMSKESLLTWILAVIMAFASGAIWGIVLSHFIKT